MPTYARAKERDRRTIDRNNAEIIRAREAAGLPKLADGEMLVSPSLLKTLGNQR